MTREEAEKEIRDAFTEVWADGIIKALEQETFINIPCISEKVCEHDKNVVLDKIRAEIDEISADYTNVSDKELLYRDRVLGIIDKYKGETEGQRMTREEHDKIILLMKHASLHDIDTGRLDGKCEDVIPLEDAIAIIDNYKAESEE